MQNPGKVNNSDYREKEIMEGNKNLMLEFQNKLVSNFVSAALFISLSLILNQYAYSQIQFATLKGTPIDTSGWKINGVAFVGTTSSLNASKSEVILCDKKSTFSFGSIYYKKPLKINETCNQWTVNFEFRINDGNSADGLAFFYVDKPENPTKDGSAIGIPMSATGIALIIDTYENCCSQGFNCTNNNNPELQLRKLSPNKNYLECDTLPGTTINNLTYLRSKDYQKMTIVFKSDSIFVSVRDNLLIKYPVSLNLSGYFGFSAANGGSFDTHSIRNVEITVPRNTLTVDAGRDTTICAGNQITLGTASIAGYSYTWSPTNNLNVGTSSSPVFTSTLSGTYRLTLRTDSSKAACYFTDQVTIQVEEKPIFNIFPNDTLICKGKRVKLPRLINFQTSSISGKFIQWTPKTDIDTLNNTYPTFFPSATTTYTIWATNTSGKCKTKDTVRIRLDDLPLHTVDIGNDTVLCENQTILLKANPSMLGNQFLWNNGDNSNQILVNSIGKYWLSIRNSNGCNEIIDTINVRPCPPEIQQIPNVFTPNEDGKNDLFFVNTTNIADYSLEIFNRWGEKVHASKDKKSTWDAKNLPDGIYNFYIKYAGQGDYSTFNERKGYIQIIR